MRGIATAALALTPLLGCASAPAAGSAKEVKVDGYLEWRKGSQLVVDGQRIVSGPQTRFKGAARSATAIPLGYEVKAKGPRGVDGAIVAREIEAKPNGSALFEGEVLSATNQAEAQYRKAGRFFEEGERGIQTIGKLYERGPEVARVRRIMNNLVPPYLNPDNIRVYVIENEEWNAFAMGNYSIYVFSGMLDDFDDDEIAIVLGHELVHASHEHTRRQFKKSMWVQLVALGAFAAAEEIDNETYRAITQLVAGFGAMAYSNGYGRNLEDQADRVGLRYAYEAGYDITKGPALWNRFAQKYGESDKVVNFFFGNHSLARERAKHLQHELATNYPDAGEAARLGPRSAESSTTGWKKAPKPKPGARPGPHTTSALTPSQSAAKTSIKKGMTTQQVRKALGAPEDVVIFGQREKWTYPEMIIVFSRGRVEQVR